ncbi:MAG: TerB family tellurite resistance protein [Acidobacteria bacterium]|nr:TerB family tellurite resistance protein [Acidobacteriota bacterium]MCB9399722.1 TerB family tellurite resistance protein [Acidobacteriota bacterium]
MVTWQSIRALFAAPEPDHQPLDIQTAIAILFLEVASSDDAFVAEERREIDRLLQKRFGLSADEHVALLAQAREYRKTHADVFHATREIAEQFTPEERFAFLVEVWRVVLADGVISFEEDSFMRKLVNLLRLDRIAWVQARDEALKQMETFKREKKP